MSNTKQILSPSTQPPPPAKTKKSSFCSLPLLGPSSYLVHTLNTSHFPVSGDFFFVAHSNAHRLTSTDLSIDRDIRWHDSMYYEGSYFWQLFHDTQVYTRRATSIYCGSPARYIRFFQF